MSNSNTLDALRKQANRQWNTASFNIEKVPAQRSTGLLPR